MTDFQKQFFARLHIEEKDTVSFEDLSNIMYAMAQTVPFENLNILEKNFKEISKENLKEKILVNNRGGLCYELNPTMYYFLKDSDSMFISFQEQFITLQTPYGLLITAISQPF